MAAGLPETEPGGPGEVGRPGVAAVGPETPVEMEPVSAPVGGEGVDILRKLKPADAVDLFGVVGLSYHADSGGPEWWLMLLRDRVLDSALQSMKDYLDNPLKGKKPLQERFPPEDYEAKLSPAQEVRGRKTSKCPSCFGVEPA